MLCYVRVSFEALFSPQFSHSLRHSLRSTGILRFFISVQKRIQCGGNDRTMIVFRIGNFVRRRRFVAPAIPDRTLWNWINYKCLFVSGNDLRELRSATNFIHVDWLALDCHPMSSKFISSFDEFETIDNIYRWLGWDDLISSMVIIIEAVGRHKHFPVAHVHGWSQLIVICRSFGSPYSSHGIFSFDLV